MKYLGLVLLTVVFTSCASTERTVSSQDDQQNAKAYKSLDNRVLF